MYSFRATENDTVLRRFRSLQQLIVEKGQSPKKQLAKVPAWTKVVIVPKEAEDMDSKEEERANAGIKKDKLLKIKKVDKVRRRCHDVVFSFQVATLCLAYGSAVVKYLVP